MLVFIPSLWDYLWVLQFYFPYKVLRSKLPVDDLNDCKLTAYWNRNTFNERAVIYIYWLVELLFWPDCLNANLDISYFCLQSNFRIYAYSLYTHVFNLSAVDCGPLPVLINGSSYGSLTYFPNSIQFSCDSGFLLRGSSGRSCLPTGLWSGSNTTCEGQLLVKWSLFLHFLQFLSSWSNHWIALSTLQDADVQDVSRTYYQKMELMKKWHQSRLKRTKRTQRNSRWSCCICWLLLRKWRSVMTSLLTRSFPVLYSSVDYILSRLICFLALDCGTLAVPMNGSFKGTRTYFPNVLQFSCDEGFILGGATERQCLADGSWSGNDTSCKGLILQKKRKKELTKLNAYSCWS